MEHGEGLPEGSSSNDSCGGAIHHSIPWLLIDGQDALCSDSKLFGDGSPPPPPPPPRLWRFWLPKHRKNLELSWDLLIEVDENETGELEETQQ
jgi:hypothetical protein